MNRPIFIKNRRLTPYILAAVPLVEILQELEYIYSFQRFYKRAVVRSKLISIHAAVL